jgi:hypothetical protein
MHRFLLLLTPAFIIYSAANAQAPPVTLDVPGGPPSNNIVPPPDTSPNTSRPPPKFKMPDGFGGLKEEPSVIDSAPDQTGSTTVRPNPPLSEPNDNGQP